MPHVYMVWGTERWHTSSSSGLTGGMTHKLQRQGCFNAYLYIILLFIIIIYLLYFPCFLSVSQWVVADVFFKLLFNDMPSSPAASPLPWCRITFSQIVSLTLHRVGFGSEYTKTVMAEPLDLKTIVYLFLKTMYLFVTFITWFFMQMIRIFYCIFLYP